MKVNKGCTLVFYEGKDNERTEEVTYGSNDRVTGLIRTEILKRINATRLERIERVWAADFIYTWIDLGIIKVKPKKKKK